MLRRGFLRVLEKVRQSLGFAEKRIGGLVDGLKDGRSELGQGVRAELENGKDLGLASGGKAANAAVEEAISVKKPTLQTGGQQNPQPPLTEAQGGVGRKGLEINLNHAQENKVSVAKVAKNQPESIQAIPVQFSFHGPGKQGGSARGAVNATILDSPFSAADRTAAGQAGNGSPQVWKGTASGGRLVVQISGAKPTATATRPTVSPRAPSQDTKVTPGTRFSRASYAEAAVNQIAMSYRGGSTGNTRARTAKREAKKAEKKVVGVPLTLERPETGKLSASDADVAANNGFPQVWRSRQDEKMAKPPERNEDVDWRDKRVRNGSLQVPAEAIEMKRLYHARVGSMLVGRQKTSADELAVTVLHMYLSRIIMLMEDHAKCKNPIVVVFDARHLASKPGERVQLCPSYKSARPQMPDELKKLVPLIKEVSRAIGANVFEAEGFEADDVIATIAQEVSQRGEKMYIVSNDKDFQQLLVDDQVFILKPVTRTKGVRWQTLTAKDFRQLYRGLEPNRFPDILALAGDASDCVPGVKGIGFVTAPALLAETPGRSLESLLTNLQDVEERFSREIKRTKNNLQDMKRVLTLKRDVPMRLGHWLGLRYRNKVNFEKLDRIFGVLGGSSSRIRQQIRRVNCA